MNEDRTYWKGFDSLVNYAEDSDVAMLAPVRLIEHNLIIKAWHVLTEYIMNEVAEEELISYHIQESTYLFPYIDAT